MTPLPNIPTTASAALARAAYEYFAGRKDVRTKRLLVHHYPRRILESTAEAFYGLAEKRDGGLFIADKRVTVGLIQPPNETDSLKAFSGWQYGCSPDWPVRARDVGGFLLLLCPPDWYESLHESIRSNSFMAFDQGQSAGAPSAVATAMIAAAGLDEPEENLLKSIVRELLARAQRRRHDVGIVDVLEALERYLGEDAVPSPASLRALGLVPDARLTADLDEREVRRLVRDNLDYQATLSAEMARLPSKYLQERFPTEAERPIAERLRAHVAQFDYDLRVDDLTWRTTWPPDLTLGQLLGKTGTGPLGPRPKATVRALTVDSVARWEDAEVVEANGIDLTWKVAGPEEARSGEVTAFVDGIEIEDATAQLSDQYVQIPNIPPGRHTVELRASDDDELEVLGQTRCEVFVVKDGIVPFSIRGQRAIGDRFEVLPGRDVQLVWRSPADDGIAQWVVKIESISGTTEEVRLSRTTEQYRVDGGITEPTDFELSGVDVDGRRVCGALLQVSPVADDERKAIKAASVAQGLVAAARNLRAKREVWASVRTKPLDIKIEEVSEVGYTIRFVDGDQVVWEQRCNAPNSELLDGMERGFTAKPDRPWLLAAPARWTTQPWPCHPSKQPEIATWEGQLRASAPGLEDYLSARRTLFERMGERSNDQMPPINTLPLADFETEIVAYATAYRRALEALVKDGNAFQSFHALLSLVDTVAFVSNVWRDPYAVAGDRANVVALAVAPTHPLRLLWLLQLELAVRAVVAGGGGGDFNPDSFSGLSGMNYPPYLVDFDRHFYRNVGVSPTYGWALYLPEAQTESDTFFSPVLQKALELRTTGENVAVSAEQIRNALAYYHEAFPFRDVIRFHYIGAGSGERIVEALTGWEDGPRRATGARKAVSRTTAERMRFVVNLLDVYEAERPAGTGRAFEEYASQSSDEDPLLENALFAVQTVERSRFERVDAELPQIPRHHIVFGSDFFATRGDTLAVEGHAYPLAAWGLRNLPTKAIDGGADQRLFISAVVPKPAEAQQVDGERREPATKQAPSATTASPQDRLRALANAEDEIHRLSYAFQVMSSISSEHRVYHLDVARMQVIELDSRAAGAIDRMHRIAEWVYIVDAHIDVELFDRPGPEHYILDYRPTIGATGPRAARHNYVITTRDNTQIVSVVERFLSNQYAAVFSGQDGCVARTAAERLLKTLNRVSGRSILTASGAVDRREGGSRHRACPSPLPTTGTVAARPHGTLRTGSPTPHPRRRYFDLWWADRVGLDGQGRDANKQHADLLDADIGIVDGVATIKLQLIEVKNLYGSYSSGGLSEPAEQVRAMHRTLETVLFGPDGSGRRDEPIKTHEFVQILDFYLRRSFMQTLGQDSEALSDARLFRIALQEAAVTGNLNVALGYGSPQSDSPSAGAILHFTSEPGVPAFSLDRSAYFTVEGSPPVRYLHLGSSDVAALLCETKDLAEDDLRAAINGVPANERGNEPEGSPNGEEPQASGGAAKPVASTVGLFADRIAERPTSTIEQTDLQSDRTTRHEEQQSASTHSVDTAERAAQMLEAIKERTPYVEQATAAFAGFIGNEEAKQLLIPILVQGLRETTRALSMSILFDGPPSTGKTELARRIAGALKLPFLQTSGAALGSIDELLTSMRNQAEAKGSRLQTTGHVGGRPVHRFPPMCVFIDEAHELKNVVQQALLTFLEPKDRRGGGPKTKYVADVSEVTFVFATTDFGSLDRALRTRMQRITLAAYTQEEVERIVIGTHPNWPAAVYHRLVVAGRRVPRIALERAQTLQRHLETYPDQSPEDALDRLFSLWKMDKQGISEEDRNLLQALAKEGRPLGINYLANQLGSSEADITDLIEPYLTGLGFVERTGSGRAITAAGQRYLAKMRQDKQP